MPKLIIVRGLPGSGKSTFAKTLDAHHYESDMFFMRDGVYEFDISQIQAAHKWCYERVLQNLCLGKNVVVSNTFTQLWEMKKYLDLKDKFEDLDIEIYEVKTQFENVHNVPEKTLRAMKQRWQNIDDVVTPLGIKVTVIK